MPGARGELDYINVLGVPVGKVEAVSAEMLKKGALRDLLPGGGLAWHFYEFATLPHGMGLTKAARVSSAAWLGGFAQVWEDMRELFPTVTAFAITDQAGSEHNEHSESVAPEEPDAGHPPASRLETLVTQQIAMMQMMMAQMKDLNKRVEIVEDAAAKAMTQGSEAAQSGDTELEALKKLLYVPHVAGHPFPARLGTLETEMPQLYDLHNDKTYDGLSKRTNSSMRYEQSVLAPALSYMHDSIAYGPDLTFAMRLDNFLPLGRPATKAHLAGKGAEQKRGMARSWREQRGAWVRVKRRRYVSQVFLVPKTGTNKWRLVMDFRWLNAHCVKSWCKMETLKNCVSSPSQTISVSPSTCRMGTTRWFADELADVSYYPHGVGGYKTVPSFLWELTDKVVRLYGDNRAVVAMLFHFTSRNPELIRRMRRLWIHLKTSSSRRDIRSEANKWAERLSKGRDLEDWRLNRWWFMWSTLT
ncbi:hypothetical protein CYMTET_52690 [Cymbomonas tetramitiformis]|uniref:Uncharacterized protein n=1 Tax=Cymbomonas tetramitiformis TaxID=36881 RepID=A0AAE0ER37_9CHLO|nr:hypothetical protein CYMTET_52690 [Cymbomonas tetramitiformis]